MKNSGKEKYLRAYGVRPVRPCLSRSLEGVELAVVIPALAEKTSLFATLASLAINPPADLRRTLVICVVNNHPYPIASQEEIDDNRQTLQMLRSLVFEDLSFPEVSRKIHDNLKIIADSSLRIAFIDASSAGNEIPEWDGGVGTARKIGMDAALALLVDKGTAGLIGCLDADTLVQNNYLSSLNRHFANTDDPAAVVNYSHQIPENKAMAAAICCYEIYLRYYVLGLAYAGSPYAFHSIGSTMACTVDGYCAVRGMNRRPAAEDFHFLNKLAKVGRVGVITGTTVFPSARSSTRVPFGTGCRVIRHMSGELDEYRLYDSAIFLILKKWIELMSDDPLRRPEAILAEARHIHSGLEEYLISIRFAAAWRSIQNNSQDPAQLRRQFHVWFDGLKTLRLVHHLSRTVFPLLPMFVALRGFLPLTAGKYPLDLFAEDFPSLDIQLQIIGALRDGSLVANRALIPP